MSSEVLEITKGLRTILASIAKLSQEFKRVRVPTLVAVSKTKPYQSVKLAYDLGQRHFGENYVQEVVEKASKLPDDIRWHYIGHLQKNKCSQLLGVKSLYMVESVDSTKLADKLNQACITAGRDEKSLNKLRVLVQVNTSGEQSKSGCSIGDCKSLVNHVLQKCSALQFQGLMTIGALNAEPDESFQRLVDCQTEVIKEFKLDPANVLLSMGMSADYPIAIKMGSDIVRIGSSIFGHRDYSSKKSAEDVPQGTQSSSSQNSSESSTQNV